MKKYPPPPRKFICKCTIILTTKTRSLHCSSSTGDDLLHQSNLSHGQKYSWEDLFRPLLFDFCYYYIFDSRDYVAFTRARLLFFLITFSVPFHPNTLAPSLAGWVYSLAFKLPRVSCSSAGNGGRHRYTQSIGKKNLEIANHTKKCYRYFLRLWNSYLNCRTDASYSIHFIIPPLEDEYSLLHELWARNRRLKRS